MTKAHHPRRGSLGYSPRKKVASPIPKIRSWPNINEVKILGFAGYKAGMTHVVIIDDRKDSISSGEEITRAVTVIETPPLAIFGVRLYGRNTYGLYVLDEFWVKELAKQFSRAVLVPKKNEKSIEDLESLLDETVEVRALVHTQPWLTGIGQKKPEIMEYSVSGNVKEAFELVKNKLGGTVSIGDIFQDGEYVDFMCITKGKGFQGTLKRWGTKHLPRKTRNGRRTAGNLGPTTPSAMMWRVPQSGQMGYHHRTEYNKRILNIVTGDNPIDITPKGGFLSYGIVKNDYILVDGSIAGPRKHLVRFRQGIRKKKTGETVKKPEINYISLESKQGV